MLHLRDKQCGLHMQYTLPSIQYLDFQVRAYENIKVIKIMKLKQNVDMQQDKQLSNEKLPCK